MSCFKPKDPIQREAEEVNKKINKQLQVEKKSDNKIKLLLLGTGECGKSTIAKQMKIIHLKGYESPDERLRFKKSIHDNLLDNTITLLNGAKLFDIHISPSSEEAARHIYANEEDFHSDDFKGFLELSHLIQEIWKDEGIQRTYLRANELQLIDSAKYFFDNLDRISESDYIPTVEDILHVRIKTTGINEIDFTVGKYQFKMVDVGGQRNERRKWIHCFDNVSAIIFVVGLSEYDQKCAEDNETNRMFEALKLFEDVTNSRFFFNTPVILFLNKRDLFMEKIQKRPLSVCFSDYTGKDTYEEASAFVEKKFTSKVQNPNKLMYTYKTCATDTRNVEVIFKAVREAIVTEQLNNIGFMVSGSESSMTGTQRDRSSTRRSNGTVSKSPSTNSASSSSTLTESKQEV